MALGHLVARQFARDRAAAQDDDAVGALDEFLDVGGDEQDGEALAGEVVDEALDLGLGADVDAAGGFVEQQDLGLQAEPAGQQDLLLVAAGELADLLFGARRLDPQPLHEDLDDAVLLGAGDDTGAGEARHRGQHDVLAHREAGDDAFGLAVLGQQADAGPDGTGGGEPAQGASADPDLTGVQAQRTGQGLRGLAAAGAEEPTETEHLTGVQRQGYVVELVVAGESGRGEHRGARGVVALGAEAGEAGAADLGHVAAEHHRDELHAVEVGEVAGVDVAAVAEHGDAVADPVELIHAVADVEHRDPACAQVLDDPEEGLDLARLQRGGGFVHDDDLGVDRDGAGEGDHLLGADAQGVQGPLRVDAYAETVEQFGGLTVHTTEVDQAETVLRLTPEEDVARHAHQRDEVHLLVDRGDTGLLRLERPGEGDLLPGQPQLALVGLVDAGQHLDQGGLAGSVLPHQCVGLPGAQGEGDVVEGDDAREPLAHRARFEDGPGRRGGLLRLGGLLHEGGRRGGFLGVGGRRRGCLLRVGGRLRRLRYCFGWCHGWSWPSALPRVWARSPP